MGYETNGLMHGMNMKVIYKKVCKTHSCWPLYFASTAYTT